MSLFVFFSSFGFVGVVRSMDLFIWVVFHLYLWAHQKSFFSWFSESEEGNFIGPTNPWFAHYAYIPSRSTSVETDPNWEISLNSEDEEIDCIFSLQIDLLYIDHFSLLQMKKLLMVMMFNLIMIFIHPSLICGSTFPPFD